MIKLDWGRLRTLHRLRPNAALHGSGRERRVASENNAVGGREFSRACHVTCIR